MLTLSPNLYSAGLRPSLRAMSDSIFGGDVWHTHAQAYPSCPSYPPYPYPYPYQYLYSQPQPHPQLPPSPRQAPTHNSRAHSRSSSSSVTLASPHNSQVNHSPTLALARAFRPPEGHQHPVLCYSSSSSLPSPTGSEAWPSPRGIEYVRATVTLQAPPRRGRQRQRARPDSTPTDERRGIQPLLLESKARPSSRPRHTKTPPASSNSANERRGSDVFALQRTVSNTSAKTDAEAPTGLRPLMLASKARPARSAEERARARMGIDAGENLYSGDAPRAAEPETVQAHPAAARLNLRERARRTIAGIADIDW